MALFNLKDGNFHPVRRVNASSGLLEKHIEDLAWNNLSEICGEPLFAVKRQASVGGGIPDIVALDPDGRIVVIEIKRGMERGQLSQILEYAGWAAEATFDEIAGMYHRGSTYFWSDWQGFTDTETRVQINRDPRMFLIAEDYSDKTRRAIKFLASKKIAVSVISVAIYESAAGEKFIDVQGIQEPAVVVESQATEDGYDRRSAWRISVKELLDNELLNVGEQLAWVRPKLGKSYTAKILENGDIEIEDGRIFYSPSGAAMAAAGMVSANGWISWRVPRLGENVSLADVQQILGRQRFEEQDS
jgi:hypothetical protein